MASGIFQNSNKDNAGDFIGVSTVTQSCEPCMKTYISKTATVFCKDCDEFLCDTCKNPHTVYKPGQHNIVNVQGNQSALVIIGMKEMDKCHEHEREIEFFCQDHSKLCCSSCVLIHRQCGQVDEITKVPIQARPELQALKQSLVKLQSEADAIESDCEQSEIGLNESIAKIASEVDTMRDRIIQLFEDAKQKFITEANEFKTAETKRIRNTRDASSKVKDEVSKILSMCCIVLESGTPSQQYIYSKLINERRKTMESNAYDQKKIKVASTVAVYFSKELTSFLEVGSNFIQLNYDGKQTAETSTVSLSSEPRPVTLELLVSVDLHKTGDDEKDPWLTGLDFLPDGRLVAVDCNNKKCIIMNERLQRLGTQHKFKGNPICVVCVSHDALCVTFGNIVSLLSVSTDNTITMSREVKTSFFFYSICYMSPSHMVVSTWGDPHPAAIISLQGVESDFEHVTFPSKTYKLDESMCTYVTSKNTLVLTDRLANTVYMYETVKGTSRAVTDRNINQPRGAAVGPGDTVLVCSEKKNSIVHMTIEGKILGTFPVDMPFPYSICVSKDGTRLAVSNGASGAMKLHLYKISPVMS